MKHLLARLLVLVLPLVLPAAAWAEKPDPMFTEAEEADFAGAGDHLCQQALGLEFLLPPPGFKVNKPAQEKLVKTLREPGPSAWGWVWLNEEKGQLIVLEMVKGPATADDFLYFADKVEKGFGGATGFTVENREAETLKQPFRFELKAKLANGNAFDFSCVSTPARHRDPAVACIVTFAPDHDALAKIRQSLSFSGCR